MNQQRREKNTAMLEWFDALVFALTLVLVLFLFVMRSVTVDGDSMIPTLTSNDQLLARSIMYKPKRSDIVLVDSYTSFGIPLVKRVIALGGDSVDINFNTGDVYVNGDIIDEPYISAATTRFFDVQFPLIVPEGSVFLMGDNRPYSKDSRHTDIGFIDERDILGQVFLRIMPLDKFGEIT